MSDLAVTSLIIYLEDELMQKYDEVNTINEAIQKYSYVEKSLTFLLPFLIEDIDRLEAAIEELHEIQ
jgi:hypothetical protein